MRKRVKIVRGLVVGVMVAMSLALVLNRGRLFDMVRTWQYKASDEVIEIENALKLTWEGDFVFRATWPELDGADEFNVNCASSDMEVSVLGCYTNNRIYAYRIQSDELDGIEESTIAHELLHAIWERMGAREKDEITKELLDVYDKRSGTLADEMIGYGEGEKMSELYARIGTEIRELPDGLEHHYGKFFSERGAVVAYYEGYNSVFMDLERHLEELEVRASELRQEIEYENEAYKKESEGLEADVVKFNDCAKTVGCFSSQSEFDVRRAELLKRQEILGVQFDKLDAMIDEYNQMVEEYNSNILRGEVLNSVVNSNSRNNNLTQ